MNISLSSIQAFEIVRFRFSDFSRTTFVWNSQSGSFATFRSSWLGVPKARLFFKAPGVDESSLISLAAHTNATTWKN